MDEYNENVDAPVNNIPAYDVPDDEGEIGVRENVWRRLGLNKHFSIAVMAFLVIAASILFGYCVMNIGKIIRFLGKVISAATPILCGLVIAYVLKPIYNRMERWLENKLLKRKKFQANPDKADRLSKAISSITVVLVLVLLIVGIVAIVIPELYKSIVGLTENMPVYIQNAREWLHGIFKNNPKMDETVMKYFDNMTDSATGFLNELFPQISNVFEMVSSGLGSMMSIIYNVGIGLVFAVYILNEKDKLVAQMRKIGYSIIREDHVGWFRGEIKYADKVFSGFVFARFMDSVLLGVIYAIVGSLIGLPYVGMSSIIIGITNMIPFFGMYIGLVPNFIILFLISPLDAVIFLVVHTIIIQVDANLISPKIMGNSTGLSGFWVLFALILFGGLWGFFGMLVGVPLFAVIYHQIRSIVDSRLKKKNMSTELEEYIRDPVIKKRTKEKRLRESRAEALKAKLKMIKEEKTKNDKNKEDNTGDPQ
ncbi:MAG: AI-2E family transporter [Lachnospiraceae bacterium]|nr:AI-2E family transporter [Lachnospiraceae bacterium]